MPGYQVEALRPDEVKEGMVCCHCSHLLRDPIQTAEGERVCRSCFSEILNSSNSCCDDCGIEAIGVQCYPDRAINRQILKLLVRCRYSSAGCQWVGPLADWETHGTMCEEYRGVPCPYPDCRELVPSRELDRHKQECSHRPHSSIRLTLSKERIASLMAKIDQLQKLLKHLEPMEDMLQAQEIEDIFEGPREPVILGSRECRAEVLSGQEPHIFNGTYENVVEGLALLDPPPSDLLHLETQPVVQQSVLITGTHTLQLADICKKMADLEHQVQASLASTHTGSFLWRIPEFSKLRREAIEEKITSIYSLPFYTGRNGYKMCIRAYLNGDGMGYRTHLSLFFVIMKGEYDQLLKWPFDYKVSMILIGQTHRKHIVQTFKPTPESNSFMKPVSDMNVASGYLTFTKLSVFGDPENDYVKDDIMFVKCIVDTTRIFHP